MDLIVSKLKTLEQLAALETEWLALETRSGASLPFVTWEWALNWWRELSEAKLGVTDALDVRTVRNSAGELVAIAPMMITKRPGRGLFQFRHLQFFGADPSVTELRGMLSVPERLPDIYRALLDDICASAADWDWAVLSGLPEGPVYQSLVEERFEAAAWSSDTLDYILPLPGSWEELRRGLRHNIKESLRKCYNSLKRDGLDFQLEVVRDGAAMRGGLEHFFRLHQARADVTGTISHANVFGDSNARRFLVSVCTQMAARGAARVFLLRVDGRIGAVRVGFVVNNRLYLYFSGYEPSLSKYSIMTTATAEAIKYAIGQGYSHVNLSPGTDVSKTRWAPQACVSREVVVVAPHMRGQVMHELYVRGRHAIDNTPTLELLERLVRRGRTAGPTIYHRSRSPSKASHDSF